MKRSYIFDLVEADKIEFNVLKGIFFKYLKPSKHQYYNEPSFKEGDLKRLFECLDNCVLLVEQLARFLCYMDRMTYEEIVNHLEIGEGTTLKSYMSSFSLSSMTDQEKRNKEVGFFLSRLISYADLDGDNNYDIQKKIVRLFTVWERVYYSADVVSFFLVDNSVDDVHKIKINEDAVRFALGQLVDKRIFDTKEEDGKTKYQIHGLIAEACRKQIFADPKFSDFSDYIAIIDSLKWCEYDYFCSDDMKSIKGCVGYSLANFVSFDVDFLWWIVHASDYCNGLSIYKSDIYERALKIKFFRIANDDKISDFEIYSNLEKTEIKNVHIEQLYYKWLDNESGYITDIKNYESIGTHVVDEMIESMVYVEGGSFVMWDLGATEWCLRYIERWFGVARKQKVSLGDFYIGETQVTQGLWNAIMGNGNNQNSLKNSDIWKIVMGNGNPSSHKKGDDYPVVSVTWFDCMNFIMELNRKTKLKFRLPTEAQWEYAARGGIYHSSYRYSGSNIINKVAWYNGNSQESTHPVKLMPSDPDYKKPNVLGIFGMSGNVEEWCQDWYEKYDEQDKLDPHGPTSGSERVVRGGSYRSDDESCRVYERQGRNPGNRYGPYGLRLALSVPQLKSI